MGNLINITLRDLERVIYYSSYIVIEPGKQEVEANQLLDEEEYLTLRAKAREEGDTAFRADIGAPAVRELLEPDRHPAAGRGAPGGGGHARPASTARSRCSSGSRSWTRSSARATRATCPTTRPG